MHCPSCGCADTTVKDSRPKDARIRRRRLCEDCGHRFTTHEMVVPVSVSAHSTAMALERIGEAITNLAEIQAIFDDAHEAALAEGN